MAGSGLPEECLARHDGRELDQLYAEFAGRLAQIVRHGVRAPEDVIEDACQVAWTRLIGHRKRVTQETARGWLAKTAVHEAFKLTRRESRNSQCRREVGGRLGDSAASPYELLAYRERLSTVSSLPTRQQRFVWLRALGLSYDEMAAREGCTARTVERQLALAGERLRGLESVTTVGPRGSCAPAEASALTP